jgi:hypothetical protein
MSGTSKWGSARAFWLVNAIEVNKETPATFTLCMALPYDEEGAAVVSVSGVSFSVSSEEGAPDEAPARH